MVYKLLFEDSSGSGDDDVAQDCVVHAVLAMEVGDMVEILGKFSFAVDQRIAVGKEAPAVIRIVVFNIIK